MRGRKRVILIVIALAVVIIATTCIVLAMNKKSVDDYSEKHVTNVSIENPTKDDECSIIANTEICAEVDAENTEEVVNYDPSIYNSETGEYYFTVNHADFGTRIVSAPTEAVAFQYLYLASGFLQEEELSGNRKANCVHYDNEDWYFDIAYERLMVDYRNGSVTVSFNDEMLPEEVYAEYTYKKLSLGEYKIQPRLSVNRVLFFVIYDKNDGVYEKTVQPLIEQDRFFQYKEPDEWMLKNWEKYSYEHKALSATCREIDILDEIKNLTGRELSEYDKKVIRLFFEYMQDTNCYIPGAASADIYVDLFSFDMVDLNKDEKDEIFVAKYPVAVYIPNDTWTDSLVMSDIIAINVDEGILDMTQGDQTGNKIYYRLKGTETETLASLGWERTDITDTSYRYSYYFDDSVKGKTEISKEEFEENRYGVVQADINPDIDWKELNAFTVLQYFYEK